MKPKKQPPPQPPAQPPPQPPAHPPPQPPPHPPSQPHPPPKPPLTHHPEATETEALLGDGVREFLESVSSCHDKLAEYNRNCERVAELQDRVTRGLSWGQEARRTLTSETE